MFVLTMQNYGVRKRFEITFYTQINIINCLKMNTLELKLD